MRHEDALTATLAPLLNRRWLLVGIGNELRGDDAFGPRLARRIDEAGGPAIDAGPSPENVTSELVRRRPEVLLLADAADFGDAPGTIRVLAPDALEGVATSTHDPGLRLLLAYLESRAPGLVVRVVAVQAASRTLGGLVHPAVLSAEARLAGILWPGPVT